MLNTSRYQLPLLKPNIKTEKDVRHGKTHNTALKEIISQTDRLLVSLSSKTHVFEDKMTKYQSVRPIISFCSCHIRTCRPVFLPTPIKYNVSRTSPCFIKPNYGASYMRATSTVKTLSFLTVHPDKKCKLRSACLCVIRVYTVAIPSVHCRRTAITSQLL